MTIKKENGVRRTTLGELLSENLRIPSYQRPYSWPPETALQLLDDISGAMNDKERNGIPYILGAVIIHNDGDTLNLVDGQQRLLTLRIILDFIENKNITDTSIIYNSNPIGIARSELYRVMNSIDKQGQYLTKLSNFINNNCELIRIETNDIDEAFRVFDSQNYRGKPLAPHDLLKAYHLREMRNEAPAINAAAVEAWESVRDCDLDRLFSTYLYRIVRWSRGESAPGFNIYDINLFKGISPKKSQSPHALYHFVAQTTIPLVNQWKSTYSEGEKRDYDRTRFQLDVPLLAGRPFFEMVSFMLVELRTLAGEAFNNEREKFSLYNLNNNKSKTEMDERATQSRYRYVSELYLAALLYYTNRFGTKNLKIAQDHIFKWAYSLRVKYLRLQFRSVDNFAWGKDSKESSAFMLIRNSEHEHVIRALPAIMEHYSDDHEKDLINFINNMESKESVPG